METDAAGLDFGRVSMVANDLQSNVYVLHRNGDIDPLVVFDAEGNYLRSWGKGVIDHPHGVRVDRENHVWVVDRAGAILKFTTDGKLLMTIGTKGRARQRREVVRQPDGHRMGFAGNTYIADGTATAAWPSSTRPEIRHVVGHAGRARASSEPCTRFSSTRRIAPT